MTIENPTLADARRCLNQTEIDELCHLMGFKVMSPKQWKRVNQLWDYVSDRMEELAQIEAESKVNS